ncbi:hypothetical protein LCGC14_0702520 [marine sediment metagenome]|uniref:Uncharacterized protein n=1 Tax=marine sediment metagenome TaxID=412755 RepID=A0A0F9TQ35_9ZZZZ
MSEEFKTIVDSSYDNGTPLWMYTKDYIYGMISAGGDRWTEVSYTFEDPDEPLYTTERGADLSFQFLMEELSKGVSFEVDDLKVPALKEFANGLGEGSDKINGLIAELINNTSNYTANTDFLIKSKDELGKLKEKV